MFTKTPAGERARFNQTLLIDSFSISYLFLARHQLDGRKERDAIWRVRDDYYARQLLQSHCDSWGMPFNLRALYCQIKDNPALLHLKSDQALLKELTDLIANGDILVFQEANYLVDKQPSSDFRPQPMAGSRQSKAITPVKTSAPSSNPGPGVSQPTTQGGKQEEPEKNWIDLEYLYADGSGVGGASYEVYDETGAVIAAGKLGVQGTAHVELPLDKTQLQVAYFNDPEEVATIETSTPVLVREDDDWLNRMKDSAVGGLKWTWGLIQGDFNEEATVGQIISNAIITAIPVVDQAADLRDLIASIKMLTWDKRYNEAAVWFAFVLVLVGLVPTVGSLIKGACKLIYKGSKVADLLALFNHFMKGDGIKWLNKLHAGELKKYINEAAQIAHQAFAACLGKVRELKGYIPSKLKDLHAKLSDFIATMEKVKGQINGQFTKVGDDLTERLGKVLSDPSVAKPASPKSTFSVRQAEAPPPNDNFVPSRRGNAQDPAELEAVIKAKRFAPNDFADIQKQLANRREEILSSGYQGKYTDEELLHMAKSLEMEDRFLVSFQPVKDPSDPLGFKRLDTGRTTVWLTSIDQVEANDTMPELIAKSFATPYDPNTKYALYVLDKGPNYKVDGSYTFIPTWENMRKYGPNELGADGELSKEALAQVMTPEYAKKYDDAMNAFWETGLDQFDRKDIDDFAKTQFGTVEEIELFKARHYYRTQIGNNQDFLGNGLTKNNALPQEYGVLEALTIEKHPPSIEQLHEQGVLHMIPLEPSTGQ